MSRPRWVCRLLYRCLGVVSPTGRHLPVRRSTDAVHRWMNVAQERRDEITLTCSCGMVWKRIPLVRGGDTNIPRCPDERTAL